MRVGGNLVGAVLVAACVINLLGLACGPKQSSTSTGGETTTDGHTTTTGAEDDTGVPLDFAVETQGST